MTDVERVVRGCTVDVDLASQFERFQLRHIERVNKQSQISDLIALAGNEVQT